MDGPPGNDVCSICRGNFQIPCQANCSHWFCGDCILRVWDHGPALEPCKCPLCRCKITQLVPSEPCDAENSRRIKRYNRIQNGLMQKMRDLPFLLKRLLPDMLDPQKAIPFVIWARVFFAVIVSVIYVLSPVDIIPEALLGNVGLLDDLIIVVICFLHVAALSRAVLLAGHG